MSGIAHADDPRERDRGQNRQRHRDRQNDHRAVDGFFDGQIRKDRHTDGKQNGKNHQGRQDQPDGFADVLFHPGLSGVFIIDQYGGLFSQFRIFSVEKLLGAALHALAQQFDEHDPDLINDQKERALPSVTDYKR